MVANLKHAVAVLAAALPLALAGCSDSAPDKSEVKKAMETTLNQQIEQLKQLAGQLGNDDQKKELDKLQFQVVIDKVSDCRQDEEAHDGDGKDGDKHDAGKDEQPRWICHVTGKVSVDNENQPVDDDITLFKDDSGQWVAQ